MSHPFSLAGQRAFVSASVAGLGFEIARGLAAAGASVCLNGRNEARLAAAVERLRAEGGDVEGVKLDVSDVAEVSAAFPSGLDVDILVNAAGARDRRPFFALETPDLRRLVEQDLVAPAHLTRLAARAMVERRRGRIINVTSIAGPIARAGDAAYTAAKGGLEALTRALAAEFGPVGVTVNAIAPGYFATEPNRAMMADEETSAYLRRRTSLGRWGEPGEIAGAAVFLASPAASYVTGQVLAVDGGYLAHF